MGLVQLLTVGRSLSEARDRPHRYKLIGDALPTFGDSAGRSGIESGTNDNASEERGARMKTESREGMDTATPVFPRGRWAVAANPFRTRPAAGPTVQGELSLDQVKVVRNDLSDSDLELVELKAAAPAKSENVFAAPVVQQVRQSEERSIWQRVIGRVFRRNAG